MSNIHKQFIMKKELKIEVPNGFEIDKEKSTFELIVFKPIAKWVNDWYCLSHIDGYYVDADSKIEYARTNSSNFHRNIFPTREDAESSLALAQLLQLRKKVIGDWQPNWETDLVKKFCIIGGYNVLHVCDVYSFFMELSFPNEILAKTFVEKYKDLLNIYFKIK